MDLSPTSSYQSSEYTWSSDLFDPIAERDQAFQENLAQLDSIIQLILLPLLGKFLGRRFAHSIWSKLAIRLYK